MRKIICFFMLVAIAWVSNLSFSVIAQEEQEDGSAREFDFLFPRQADDNDTQPVVPEATNPVSRQVPGSDMQIKLSFAPLVKQVAPAVVNIYTTRVVAVQRSVFDDPFFRQFFGDNRSQSVPRERVEGSLGSGVIVSDEGVIVTNNHVVGDADSIRVILADRREYDAKVILADERTDLAILQIDAGDAHLPTIALSNSDEVEVGDLVLAIGNPFGVGQTVTSGIVSATARTQVGISDFQFFLQTDAAVNPGNSGGALVDINGELIGINTAIFSRAGENNGVSFAIPSNMVRSVVQAAVTTGQIVRPWMGIAGQAATAEIADSLGLERPGGVIVGDTYPDGPADLAGIRAGDVILKIGDYEVLDMQALNFRIATVELGTTMPITIFREGEMLEREVTLDAAPETPPRDITMLEGRHPFQGVTFANLSPRFADELGFDPLTSGVIVYELDRRSPAARRQLVRPGDIILSLNGVTINVVDDLEVLLAEPPDNYTYRLRRRGQIIECGIIGLRSFYCR